MLIFLLLLFYVSTVPDQPEEDGVEKNLVPNWGSKSKIFFSKSGVIKKNTSSFKFSINKA